RPAAADRRPSHARWSPGPVPGAKFLAASLTDRERNCLGRPALAGIAALSPEVLRRVHLAADDLAGRALRQVGHDPDIACVLIRSYPFPHEPAQFIGRRARSRLQLDGGADVLAELTMRNPDHGGLGHGRMLVEYLFDLAGGQLSALSVHDAHLDAFDRGADRAWLALPVRVVEGSDRRSL